jgi:hypothetical protein
MSKLKTDPITPSDLIEFLDRHSDFAFELLVLNALDAEGFECEHGGTYEDPFTDKPRQFDIRATKRFGQRIIRFAVECKNLKQNFPLLVSCVPRTEDESFHELAFSVDPDRISLSRSSPRVPAFEPRTKSIRLTGSESLYKPKEYVGKSSDQIGRNRENAIFSNDSDVYSKWAQAISSAQDLTDRACYDGESRDADFYFSVVLPLLVIPDDTLWVAHFNHSGSRTSAPQQADHCSFFVNMQYFAGDKLHGTQYRISHLEFVTFSGLRKLIETLTSSNKALYAVFPMDTILAKVKAEFRAT